MPAFRLATSLSLAAVLTAACQQKPGDDANAALVASVVQSVSECKAAVQSIGGAMENSMDLNVVAAARDTCNASSATISQLSAPPEAPPEQAELFAVSLRDCAQAQSNVGEVLGMTISQRSRGTADDRSRMKYISGQERSKACIDGLDRALASGGGKLSYTDRLSLTDPMGGFF